MATNISNPIGLEAAELFGYQSPLLWASLILCIPAYICNFLMIVVIAKSKAFHTKSHFTVIALCISEICLTGTAQFQNTQRLLIYYNNWLIRTSQLFCMMQIFFNNVCVSVVENFTLALSIDRLIALIYPVFYKTFNLKSYVIIINTLCWTYSLIFGFISFHGYQAQKVIPICLFAMTYEPVYYNIYYIQSDVKMILTLAFDCLAVFVLWRCLRRSRQLPLQQRRDARTNLELGTIRTIIVIEIVYFICCAMATLKYVLNLGNLDFIIKIAPAINMFNIFNSISHLFVYLIMSKTFRKAFRETFLFWYKPNSVQSMPTGTTSRSFR